METNGTIFNTCGMRRMSTKNTKKRSKMAVTSIARALERQMDARGITAYQIEKDTGISEGTVRGWLRGTMPRVDHFLQIAEYLEIDPILMARGEIKNDEARLLCDEIMDFASTYRESFKTMKKVVHLFMESYRSIKEGGRRGEKKKNRGKV
jgi:transcriptional regulator with XRE-family HTH domain